MLKNWDWSFFLWQLKANQAGGLTLHVANVLPVIKLILMIAAVALTTGNLAYAAQSGAECYHNGHRMYVPDGLNYPRQVGEYLVEHQKLRRQWNQER